MDGATLSGNDADRGNGVTARTLRRQADALDVAATQVFAVQERGESSR